MLEPTAQGTIRRLEADGVAMAIPDEFACVHWEKGGRRTTMRTECIGLPEGEARMVHIGGGKVHVINVFGYPDPAVDAPVYAMEVVVFGKRPVVAVVDLVGLHPGGQGGQVAARLLREARSRFDIVQAADMPEWYQDCRSGEDLFCRPEGMAEVDRILQAHLWLWDRYVDALDAAPRLEAGAMADHGAAVQHYKDHHRMNSPGLRFLERAFGAPWTERYLRDVVFR